MAAVAPILQLAFGDGVLLDDEIGRPGRWRDLSRRAGPQEDVTRLSLSQKALASRTVVSHSET